MDNVKNPNADAKNVATSVVRMDALCAADQRLMQDVLSTGVQYKYTEDPTDDGCDIDVAYDGEGNGVLAQLHTVHGTVRVGSFRHNGKTVLFVFSSPWVTPYSPSQGPCILNAHEIAAGQEVLHLESVWMPDDMTDAHPFGYTLPPSMIVDLQEVTDDK